MIHQIEAIAEWSGKIVAWFTLAMVLMTCTVVIGRYGFDWGSIALQESVLYLHAMVFMLGASYTLKHDEHVRVDIFYRPASKRRKHWVNLLGVVLLLWPTCGFIIYSSLDYVSASWAANQGLGEASREAGGLPLVYLLKTLIPISMGLLMVQGLALVLRSVQGLREGNRD